MKIDNNDLVKTIFKTTIDLCDSDFISELHRNKLKSFNFINEDFPNKRFDINYLGDYNKHKRIETLIDRVELLINKGLLKGIYNSFRYGKLENKEVIVWFFYLNEKYEGWSNDWINEYLQDEGGNLDPDDQDWI